MKKYSILKILNPLIGILFFNQAFSGIFHEKIPYEGFQIVHGLAGYLFTACVLLHIILNWNWFMTGYFRKKSIKGAASESAQKSMPVRDTVKGN